jgi:hypothetical protein
MAQYKFNEIFEDAQKIHEVFQKIAKDSELIHQNLSKLQGKAPLKELNAQTKELNTNQTQLLTTEKEVLNLRKKTSAINKKAITEADKITASIDRQNVLNKERVNQLKRERREEAKLILDKKKIAQLRKQEIKSDKELIDLNRRLAKVRANLTRNTKANRKEYAALTKEIVRNERIIRKNDASIGRFQRNVGNYGSALKGLVSQLGLVGGGFLIVNQLRQSVKAYEEETIAITKLTTVLRERTNATDAEVQSILDLTAAQQEQGVIGNEVQNAGAQQIATFVKQTSTIKTLIPAFNNLLAQQKGLNATQNDAVTIANLVGRALQGQTGALTRVGISFDEAQAKALKFGTEEERAATLAEVLNQNVGEVNKALAATDLGQIKQLKNEFGDIQEEIGKTLLPALVTISKALLPVIKGFALLVDLIQKASTGMGIFGAIANKEFEGKIGKSVENTNLQLDDLRQKLIAIGRTPEEANLEAVGELISVQERRAKAIKQELEEIEKQQQQTAKKRLRIAELEQEAKLVTENIKNLRILSGITDKFANNTSNATKEIEDLVAGLENLNNESKEVIKTIGDASDIEGFENIALGGDIGAARTAPVGDVLTGTLLSPEQFEKAILAAVPRYKIALAKFRFALFGEGGNFFTRLLGKEEGQQAIDVLIDTGIQLLNQFGDAIVRNAQEQTAAIDELINKQDEQIKKTEDQLNAELQRIDKLKQAGQAYDNTRAVALRQRLEREEAARRETENALKESRKREQRAAIAQANIDLASGIMRIWAGPGGYVLKIIQSAALAVLGGFQIAQIARQQFADGTESVPLAGNRPGIDTVPAMLTAGEGVITKDINQQIPYNKGFKHWMLPAAANMYLNSKGAVTPGYIPNNRDILTDIEKNTRKDKVYSNGKLITEYFDNMIINYG